MTGRKNQRGRGGGSNLPRGSASSSGTPRNQLSGQPPVTPRQDNRPAEYGAPSSSHPSQPGLGDIQTPDLLIDPTRRAHRDAITKGAKMPRYKWPKTMSDANVTDEQFTQCRSLARVGSSYLRTKIRMGGGEEEEEEEEGGQERLRRKRDGRGRGEDKHRLFKKVIYTTNHCNPEKDLLFKENLRQTNRFILANALHELYSQCPALFSGILPQSEGIEDFNEDDEDVKSDDQRRETD
ncbi:hypothetical protein V8E54_006830 [Elaphomyces granulatus]